MAKAFGLSDVSLCYINFPIWVSSTSGIKADGLIGLVFVSGSQQVEWKTPMLSPAMIE